MAAEPVTLPDLTGDSFPMESFRSAAIELRRPFEEKAIKWKVQAMWPRDQEPTGGLIVCYIDRGLVIDRLNCVVPHLWTARFHDLDDKRSTLCWLTVDGITREDVGEGRDLKSRRSDALKRAAVHFGIGVSLSRVPQSRLETKTGMVTSKQYGTKWTLDLTQKGLDYLRNRYQDWLDRVGREAFGDPLKHGDLGDAQGDDDATPDLVAGDEKASIYEELTGDRTLKRQRGLLAGAGVVGIPLEPRPEHIEAAVSAMTGEQAEKLRTLLKADIDKKEADRAAA